MTMTALSPEVKLFQSQQDLSSGSTHVTLDRHLNLRTFFYWDFVFNNSHLVFQQGLKKYALSRKWLKKTFNSVPIPHRNRWSPRCAAVAALSYITGLTENRAQHPDPASLLSWHHKMSEIPERPATLLLTRLPNCFFHSSQVYWELFSFLSLRKHQWNVLLPHLHQQAMYEQDRTMYSPSTLSSQSLYTTLGWGALQLLLKPLTNQSQTTLLPHSFVLSTGQM